MGWAVSWESMGKVEHAHELPGYVLLLGSLGLGLRATRASACCCLPAMHTSKKKLHCGPNTPAISPHSTHNPLSHLAVHLTHPRASKVSYIKMLARSVCFMTTPRARLFFRVQEGVQCLDYGIVRTVDSKPLPLVLKNLVRAGPFPPPFLPVL